MKKPEVVIIGGGLSGILIAYLLKKEGVISSVLEARSRLGGRIYTVRPETEHPIEMGATWLGKRHRHLLNLLKELQIDITEQYMGRNGFYEPMSVSPPQLVDLPPNEEPSYRIAGGTDRMIHALVQRLDNNQIHLNKPVKSIRKADTQLEIETEDDLIKADFVISTLPPKLLVETIGFSPSLPENFTEVASQTHTWMAESIKVALTFQEAFWRNSDSSGTIFSNVGPVSEMYDHSHKNRFALKGFMNSAYHAVSNEKRKQLVVEQLRRFYGERADEFTSYLEMVWQNEPYTYRNYDEPVIPHQHNGHAIFDTPLFDGRLLISGSETAKEYPGYMEGAVESAQNMVRRLIQVVS